MNNEVYLGLKTVFVPLFKKSLEEGNQPLIAFANAVDETFQSFELSEDAKTEFTKTLYAEFAAS
jgi:hypothetical protein